MQPILFVCLGNICRSPAAEAVFAARAREVGLGVGADGAGTSGWHAGDPPHPPMIDAAAARGYDLTPIRARQVVADDFAAFGEILAMDRSVLARLERLRPAGSATPLRLFLADLPGLGRDEVPDPWYTGDFDGALDLIEAGVDTLVARLKEAG